MQGIVDHVSSCQARQGRTCTWKVTAQHKDCALPQARRGSGRTRWGHSSQIITRLISRMRKPTSGDRRPSAQPDHKLIMEGEEQGPSLSAAHMCFHSFSPASLICPIGRACVWTQHIGESSHLPAPSPPHHSSCRAPRSFTLFSQLCRPRD